MWSSFLQHFILKSLSFVSEVCRVLDCLPQPVGSELFVSENISRMLCDFANKEKTINNIRLFQPSILIEPKLTPESLIEIIHGVRRYIV